MTTRPKLLVTLEGYAAEGGLDVAGAPATCYRPTIALARHEGPGEGEDLWHDYEAVVDLVVATGLDGIRLGVEWARIEPRRGVVDDAALLRYRRVARYARARGLMVTLAIVDAAWPSWLGLEAWLLPWVVPHVLEHVGRVVDYLGADVTGVVIFTDPDGLATRGYVEGSAPPWRRGAHVDAAFARDQIASIARTLAKDSVVGPRLVTSHATLALDVMPGEIAARLNATSASEVYLRSAVVGAGPTRAPAGLFAKREGEWRVVAKSELLDVLR